MGLWGDIKDAGGWVKDKSGDAWNGAKNSSVGQALGLSETDAEKRATEFSPVDPTGRLLGASQSAYRDAAYDRNNFRSGRFDQTQLIQGMQNRINGGQTVSGEMLRQGMHQNMAGQRSMAAGAGASNSAMAARNAAMNSGRMNAGLAGQQAVAGMKERLASEQALGQMLQQRRQADMQSMFDGNSRGLRGYETLENARTSRVTGQSGPSQGERFGGAVTSLLGILGKGKG